MAHFIAAIFAIKDMTDLEHTELYDIDNEYVIISKDTDNILDDLDFKNEDDRILCKSIIDNLEKQAAVEIRKMKVVQLPLIGCIRIDPIKRRLRDAKLHLSLMRKNMSKEEYKRYVKDIVHEFGQEMDKADREKLIIKKIRTANKKQYEMYYKKLGRAYAEMYIYSIRLLKEVVFDADWEEQYQSLKS